MSTFTSKSIKIDRPSAEISEKFSDLTQLQSVIDALPESERSKVGDVKFTADSISINTTQVGNIKFKVVDRTPNLVKFTAEGAPVPVNLDVNLKPQGDAVTDVSVAFDLNIPMMLRPMVAPHMQKAVDMLADVIGNVAKV